MAVVLEPGHEQVNRRLIRKSEGALDRLGHLFLTELIRVPRGVGPRGGGDLGGTRELGEVSETLIGDARGKGKRRNERNHLAISFASSKLSLPDLTLSLSRVRPVQYQASVSQHSERHRRRAESGQTASSRQTFSRPDLAENTWLGGC